MKIDAESLPDDLGTDAFGFKEGDFALITWTKSGPAVCRVWDSRDADVVRKVLALFDLGEVPPTHPLYDLKTRLEGL